jgi:hypothetical protein
MFPVDGFNPVVAMRRAAGAGRGAGLDAPASQQALDAPSSEAALDAPSSEAALDAPSSEAALDAPRARQPPGRCSAWARCTASAREPMPSLP